MKKLPIILMVLICSFLFYLLLSNNPEKVDLENEELVKALDPKPTEPNVDSDEPIAVSEEDEKYLFKFTYPKTGIEIRDNYIAESVSKKKTAFLGAVSTAGLPFQDRKYQQETNYKKYSFNLYTSYTFSTYEDMGGAHPSGYISSVTFDANDNIISLSDFLYKEYGDSVKLENIVDLIRPKLIEKLGENIDPSWMEEGIAPTLENYDTFVIDDSGIIIFFQQYQVGAYFIGSPEVYIPFDEIK